MVRHAGHRARRNRQPAVMAAPIVGENSIGIRLACRLFHMAIRWSASSRICFLVARCAAASCSTACRRWSSILRLLNPMAGSSPNSRGCEYSLCPRKIRRDSDQLAHRLSGRLRPSAILSDANRPYKLDGRNRPTMVRQTTSVLDSHEGSNTIDFAQPSKIFQTGAISVRTLVRCGAVIISLMMMLGFAVAADNTENNLKVAALIKRPLPAMSTMHLVNECYCHGTETCCLAGSGLVPAFKVCCPRGCASPPGFGCNR